MSMSLIQKCLGFTANPFHLDIGALGGATVSHSVSPMHVTFISVYLLHVSGFTELNKDLEKRKERKMLTDRCVQISLAPDSALFKLNEIFSTIDTSVTLPQANTGRAIV